MDLIYTDTAKVEVGILTKVELDFECNVESGHNTFEVKVPLDACDIEEGCDVYEVGSDIGGVVDCMKIDTEKRTRTLEGNSWRGILEQKVLEPSTGSSVYTVSGDANAILAEIITKIDLANRYEASSESSGLTIESYQFEAYKNAGEGIKELLSANGYKLDITFDGDSKKVILAAVPIKDYSEEAEISSDLFDFKLERKRPEYNHIIGVGGGEHTAGIVVHRYLDANCNVTSTQYYTGELEKIKIYDGSNDETEAEIIENVEKEILEYATEAAIDVTTYNLNADVGDKFLATDEKTGISVEEYVTSKIISVKDYSVKISYEVGETIL